MDRRTENKKRKYQILALVFGAAFICCVIWLVAYLTGLSRAEAEMEDMRDSYVSQIESESSAEPESSESVPEESAEPSLRETHPEYGLSDKEVDFASLKEEVNGDIYAWITVPGTEYIDYPVVQHPEEMDYYLEHNLDGTKGRPGAIYTQRMNSKDWTDPNTVVYGHNMWSKGTMFFELHKFEDGDFFDENRYIHIYTEDGRTLVYEIFAAYVTDNSHQLLTKNIYTPDGFQSYLDAIPEHTGKRCHFLEDREVTAEDRIITLSTCIKGENDNRYLVQGVLVAEEERQP